MRLLALMLSVLLPVAACAAQEPANNLAGIFGGADNLRLVREADTADACILHHVAPQTRPDGSVDWASERFEETKFVAVPAATLERVCKLLLDPKTYTDPTHTGGRRPQYYVRLRLHRGVDVLNIDFCFLCRVLRIMRTDGEVAGQAGFEGNQDLLVDAFLKVFPDDAPLHSVARER
jgi:hypothetical protein